ncbi:hypothetical protein CAPTEDRAFT_205041 [Capitella teleta]|uniref:Chitin-binding type-2 domain-containing protein n=1 Tax=Capitella teleta TaxID=283909 RepID=R7T9S5_CAPTE|nr:hypothetical protein CAPTEDRAFT_205041 [Capitella teleta]|eukprot:ELT90262.1 hypothetical protein CAPTEDRAFT_205041 [Capitella teleta]
MTYLVSAIAMLSMCLVSGRVVSNDWEWELEMDMCFSTGPRCVRGCDGLEDGLYQWCGNCTSFVKCTNELLYNMHCPDDLIYDDNIEKCVRLSTTCRECHIYYGTSEGDIRTEVPITPPTTTDCGSILSGVSDTPLPDGWDSFCYIDIQDVDHIDKPCSELLKDLPGFADASALLASGGNFGCWRSYGPPEDDPLLDSGCRDNYQHDIMLKNCSECHSLSVCIRYPEEGATTPRQTPVVVTTDPEPELTSVSPPNNTDCGSLMQRYSDQSYLPEPWSSLCYITREDPELIDLPCKELLQDLRGKGGAQELLDAGGNFGCWRSLLPVGEDPDISRSCRDNYQHDGNLSYCESCPVFAVCIRYPDDWDLKRRASRLGQFNSFLKRNELAGKP